jgi:hypothetical protein
VDTAADDQITPDASFCETEALNHPVDHQMTSYDTYSESLAANSSPDDQMTPSDIYSPLFPDFCATLPAEFTDESFCAFISFSRANTVQSVLALPDYHTFPDDPPPPDTRELLPYDALRPPQDLAALLSSEFTTDALMEILLFFTFSFLSPKDWHCLADSPFFQSIESILNNQIADCLGLALACLHRVFSPGRSEGPPDWIAPMLAGVAESALPIFDAVAHDDDCLPECVDFAIDLMSFMHDAAFSRSAMRCFGPSLLEFMRSTELTELAPAVWELVQVWWGCAEDVSAAAIVDYVAETVVPELRKFQPKDVVSVDVNLINVVDGVCRGRPSLCLALTAGTFPSLVYGGVVAAPDEDTALASFAFLDTLLPFMADLTWISPGWVDHFARQWLEHDDQVFQLGIQAVARRDEASVEWLEYALPQFDDVFAKKIFSTSCFAHWIAAGLVQELPAPDTLVPIVADFLYLDVIDTKLAADVQSVLLAYFDSGVDEIQQYLCDNLQDGDVGESLRSIDPDCQDPAGAVRTLLMRPYERNLEGSGGPQAPWTRSLLQ